MNLIVEASINTGFMIATTFVTNKVITYILIKTKDSMKHYFFGPKKESEPEPNQYELFDPDPDPGSPVHYLVF